MLRRLTIVAKSLAPVAGVVVGLLVGLWCVAWLARVNVTGEAIQIDPEVAAEYVEARIPKFDPNDTLSLHVDADVEPTGQSPILAELVDEDKLPPLAERLPERPIVMRGVDGIGTYGGTWLRLAIAVDDVSVIAWRLSGSTLVRWSPLGYPIENHIAESVTHDGEFRQWTVKLREGMRWSDGAPFTAADVMFWWEACTNNPHVTTTPPSWMINAGKVGDIVQIDRYTFRIEFEDPNVVFLEDLCRIGDFTGNPKHYLEQYHPDPAIGDEALIAETMAKYKLPSPGAVFAWVRDWKNPEHPRLWPWVLKSYVANPPFVFVRNPYYGVLDEAGNQLPYIDRVQFDVLDTNMLALTASNGGTSMQGRHIRFSDYTELMSRREIAGSKVFHWYSATRSNFVINPNLNRRVDPSDPATGKKAELLADKRFRQALSLAIDRKTIIDAEQSGVGVPSQVAPGPESLYDYPDLSNAFTEYDPERANALLDELGLTGRDGEGMRTFADGSRMTFYLDFSAFTGAGPGQFIVDDWGDVGVRAIARERARPLFYTEKDSLEFDFNVWTGESDLMPLALPRYFIPYNTESFYAVGWGRWYMNGGYYDSPQSQSIRGSIPVPKDSPMYAAITAYEEAKQATDPDERRERMNEMFRIAAENVWTISIATPPPAPFVADKRMKNIPENALFGAIFSTPANAGLETYYFESNDDSPGAIAETKRSIVNTTPRPAADGSEPVGVGGVIKWLAIGIGLLLLAMLAWRHPFVWKRLLLMIPTLFIISIVVFVIIQLPPGDYLSTRVMLLQESGDEANLRAIDDLKKIFRYEDTPLQQYVRWMGFEWFTTFDVADEGLIQGNLGRSMETQTPINEVVGDRLLLTMAISIGTILLTWAIALPIGIYSAVRQYSAGDYVLTVLGFLGVCTPAFLLALVLMAVSGMSGLFSPEYAAQPEWTWGKVGDLLAHIWIPIVVLGVGGTAGMIRVMRANLLDELSKPYVTTARAKGVRPLKLLVKYPVRMALNPFVSGIGHLFPQIVSGGAIVAMVLALPTVGPLLLSALFTEDMYLAGSMLMVLSLLGVFGTLVSDLLLLWLDPRIRFEGGSR